MGDSIAYLNLSGILDARYDVAYLARAEHLTWHHVHLQYAYLVCHILHSSVEELHLVALAYLSVLYLEVGNDAAERVEYRVEDECLKRTFCVAYGVGHSFNNGFQHIVNAFACLARRTQYVLALATDKFYNLVFYLVGHSAWHIDLVQHRYNLKVVLYSHIEV